MLPVVLFCVKNAATRACAHTHSKDRSRAVGEIAHLFENPNLVVFDGGGDRVRMRDEVLSQIFDGRWVDGWMDGWVCGRLASRG